ncbi:MAG TPA: VOC family protein [Microthrixaceae bacterium]|nr:VOC family protein [Microthrixaceae bacterium]
MLGDTKTFSSFAARDLDAEKKFFGETLGIDLTEEHGMLVLHLAGGQQAIVYPKADHEPASFTVLNFQVDDLDQEVDDLIAKGVDFNKYEQFDQDGRGVATDPDGGMPRIAWFSDPAGNVLSIVEDGPSS